MNTNIQKEIEKLETRKENMEEIFQDVKQEVVKLIQNSNSEMITELENYTQFNKMRKLANDIKETKIKIRCLKFCLGE